jgi:NADPH2:quinone reductase
MHAIRFYRNGDPAVLCYEKLGIDGMMPGAGEVRLRHQAIGVNFIDIYQRSGLYPVSLPSGLGLEAAGVVEAVGPGVTEFAVGDRVAYADAPLHPVGAYAEARMLRAEKLVRLPQAIDFKTAAAMMLRGLTAQYLLRQTYRVKPGDTILFHAAAGGVGLIACQWAKVLGATVIGTVSTEAKADVARVHGCDHVIVTTQENFVERVRKITDGQGVPVVYDSVGKDTFPGSLDCLQPRGLMVSFGNASGPVAPLDLRELARRGSLFLTRPTLFTYIAARADLLAMAAELFAVVMSGQVKIEVNQTYALKDAAQAHRDMAARHTTGSTILIP